MEIFRLFSTNISDFGKYIFYKAMDIYVNSSQENSEKYTASVQWPLTPCTSKIFT